MKKEFTISLKAKLLLGIIIGGFTIISLYLSIFWLGWILMLYVEVCLVIKRKYPLIVICLFTYLLFPLHLIYVVFSASATIELVRDGFTHGLPCHNEAMNCSAFQQECNYENTRNCLCRDCLIRFSHSSCVACFIHDKGVSYCGTELSLQPHICNLVW